MVEVIIALTDKINSLNWRIRAFENEVKDLKQDRESLMGWLKNLGYETERKDGKLFIHPAKDLTELKKAQAYEFHESNQEK